MSAGVTDLLEFGLCGTYSRSADLLELNFQCLQGPAWLRHVVRCGVIFF